MRYLIYALLLLSPTTVFGAVEYNRTPVGAVVYSVPTYTVSFDDWATDTATTPSNYWSVFLDHNNQNGYSDTVIADECYSINDNYSKQFNFNNAVSNNILGPNFPAFDVYLVSFDDADCNEGSWFSEYSIGDTWTYEEAPLGGMSVMVQDADTGYTTITGESMGATVSWAGDSFIKLFIGSGLALLLGLRYWILALIIIGAIVYFSYRAFRFFRHGDDDLYYNKPWSQMNRKEKNSAHKREGHFSQW